MRFFSVFSECCEADVDLSQLGGVLPIGGPIPQA